ncbi:MAG: trehalose-phosphatase [Solirubrobacteraceae bacterium]|nr:trehalose-phosphatase [Solirubrobacteraceae bacterium]
MVGNEGAAQTAAALGRLLPQLALLLDFDGTLSPIVADPDAARADPAAAEGLARLAPSAALLACVTGRPALTARRLLGVPEIAYTGLHGAQVLVPGADTPATPAAFAADGAKVHAIVDAAAAEPEGLAGLEVEDKGPIVALHWRNVADPATAERRAQQLAGRAREAGLRSGEGRCVLELRPALEVTKGDGARALIEAVPAVRHALFAGDDVTDLDAFAALRALVDEGRLDSVTLVAVQGEGAPAQVAAAADVVVPSPAALGAFLSAIADAAAPVSSPDQPDQPDQPREA